MDPAPSQSAPQDPGPYQPPTILWEQPFTALAQISPPTCDPDQDPNCPP